MNKKYLCIGDYVFSKNDGDIHWIGPAKIPQLYGVDPRVCVFYSDTDGMDIQYIESLIVLRPRSDGDYSLDEEGRPRNRSVSELKTNRSYRSKKYSQ